VKSPAGRADEQSTPAGEADSSAGDSPDSDGSRPALSPPLLPSRVLRAAPDPACYSFRLDVDDRRAGARGPGDRSSKGKSCSVDDGLAFFVYFGWTFDAMIVAICSGSSENRLGIEANGEHGYALYVPTCIDIVQGVVPRDDRDLASDKIVQKLFAVAGAFGSVLREDARRIVAQGQERELFSWLRGRKESPPHLVFFEFKRPADVQSLATVPFGIEGNRRHRANLHYEIVWALSRREAWVKTSAVYTLEGNSGNARKLGAMPATLKNVTFCCFKLAEIRRT
jgi:hypothetical protein